MYVEDDLGPRLSVHMVLRKTEYEFETAENGGDGLKKIQETTVPYDLIITGIAMPVMCGDEMISIIRRKGLTMPILVITGQYERGCKLVREKLVSACIPKPYNLNEIMNTVELLLSESLGTC